MRPLPQILPLACLPLLLITPFIRAADDEPTAQPAQPFKPYTQQIPGTDASFEMVSIPGGTFTMGSPPEAKWHQADEGPQVRVKIEPLWIGKYEITWEEYKYFMEAYELTVERHDGEHPTSENPDAVSLPTPPYPPEVGGMYPGMHSEGGFGHWKYTFDDNRPAAGMTQFAARQFTKWLSKKTGRFYRLPTEAEWEYAARAGTKTAYSFGDDSSTLEEYAWFWRDDAKEGENTTHPVGLKKPNPWGLYDMHGNVAEWVIDQYRSGWYENFAGEDLVHCTDAIAWPEKEYPRVIRGGSFWHYPDELRSASRFPSTSEWKNKDPLLPQSIWWHTDAEFVGFRVVRPLEEPSEEEKRRYWRPDAEMWRHVVQQEHGNQVRVQIGGGNERGKPRR